MKIEHLAIWVEDVELLRQFYIKYFSVSCGEKYVNTKRNFTSYFLSFGDDKTRLELMHIPDMENPVSRGNLKGLAHFAISVGGKDVVNVLTERLREDGYMIASEPRTSGDGYYESAVLDPEGNYVEIVE
ncbi:MAG: VOC family protein [Tannerella sp.]|jgi:lactoylglutathione lyase|nr:VOC family protein [Tannerella sp.]